MIKESNKLVRDNIPDIIRKNGGTSITRILNDEEYRVELIKKMHEEVNEFEKDNNIEELADIFTVFMSLVNQGGFSFEDVLVVANKKIETNGAFENKIYMSTYDDGK